MNKLLPVIEKPHVHGPHCNHKHDDTHMLTQIELPTSNKLHRNKRFTPLMERIIKSKNLTANQKELLVTGSFLTSALPVTKILGVLTKSLGLNSFTSSLITAPLAISSMHFVNRGNNNKDKLGMILASSLGGISLQNAFDLPKIILRSFLTVAVFFIEKYKPDDIQGKVTKLKKEDFIRLGKTLATILSVPALLNIPLHKATEIIDSQNNSLNKFFGHVGLTAAQILGLTFGFFGFGKAFNYGADKLGLNSSAKSANHTHSHNNNHTHNNHNHGTHGQTEGAVEVCAHCGVPGCIDSVTEGITESVESSIFASLFS